VFRGCCRWETALLDALRAAQAFHHDADIGAPARDQRRSVGTAAPLREDAPKRIFANPREDSLLIWIRKSRHGCGARLTGLPPKMWQRR